MKKEDLVIGVHWNGEAIGGQYNSLACFSAGLVKGFRNNNVKAYSTKECFERNIVPSLTIGFNASGYYTWNEYLKNNITNIMWDCDSAFFQNKEIIDEFHTNPNFVHFSVSPTDDEAIAQFYPPLKNTYVPGGVDLDVWRKKDLKKEYDIVFTSSITDYEAKIEELRASTDPETFDLLMYLYDIWANSSNLSFWQMYNVFKAEAGLDLNLEQYSFAFKKLAYIVSHAQRVKMIEKLENFNVKIFGSGPWQKYIKGNVEYMGVGSSQESVDVMNKSKIVLHLHPSQLCQGIHDRVLNASAVEAFVMSSNTNSIQEIFSDSMCYFNPATLEGIEENVAYFLKNDDERIEKAKQASEITRTFHTWDERAKVILNMVNYNDSIRPSKYSTK